jgi:hypothetical protein
MRAFLMASALLACAAEAPREASFTEARLWQERYYWDALLQARVAAARGAADPALLDVVETMARQVAQQSANLQQIQSYAKAQVGNLGFAFAQKDPGPSLAVIQNNFATLTKGSEQIRNNLYYLTARARICSTQALPDPKLTDKATILIAQIQDVQLKLNALYLDATAVANSVRAETWAADEFFRFGAEQLLGAVISVQDSVFAVYNSSYELYLLSK